MAGRPRINPNYRRVKFTITVDPETKQQLLQVAQERRTSMSQLVNAAMRATIKAHYEEQAAAINQQNENQASSSDVTISSAHHAIDNGSVTDEAHQETQALEN